MVHEMLVPTPAAYGEFGDNALVTLARFGDQTAFETLITRYQDLYLAIARRVVGENDSADVVQDALINIYRKLDTFSGDGSFKGWSCRVVVNCGRMLLRKYARRRETSSEFHDIEVDPNRWPDARTYQTELGALIQDAISALDPMYAEIIELREIQGLSMSEMSEVLGISTGGVKTRLHRARGFLRIALQPYLW